MKIGDNVKVSDITHRKLNWIATIVTTYYCDKPAWYIKFDHDQSTEAFYEYQLTLIKNNMNIKDKFTLAFKSEPEKSFRKVGITNGDDFLTDEGTELFLSWLLKKNSSEFNKEVVQDLLKEQEKESK